MIPRLLFRNSYLIMRSQICILFSNNLKNQLISPSNLLIFRKCSFDAAKSKTKSKYLKEYTDQRIVRYSQLQIFNVVAAVDEYDQFLPNCLESTVISRTPKKMEAELTVGFPPLVTERYTSLIYLEKPNRVLIKGINSKVLKHLQSEWKFEKLNEKRTLVTFNVEFEFFNKFHSHFISLFFDDFTKKTMQAFLDRAYIIYSADPLYFDDKS